MDKDHQMFMNFGEWQVAICTEMSIIVDRLSLHLKCKQKALKDEQSEVNEINDF